MNEAFKVTQVNFENKRLWENVLFGLKEHTYLCYHT